MAIDFATFNSVINYVLDARFPVLIRGRHGIGKSSIVYQKAAELGLYLMYKIGVLGSKASVQVRPSECRELGLTDRERQRQVVRLENAGLITADKGKGRCPTVTLIEHGGSDGENLIHT